MKLEKFTQFANLITEGPSLVHCCDFLFDTFQDVIPFDRIGVSLIDKESKTITLKWARAKNTPLEPYPEYRGPVSKGLKEIITEGKPRILNDLVAYLKENPNSEATKKITSSGMKSSLTCPIKSKNGCFGFLFFSSEMKDVYKNEHVESYQLIASQIGFLLEKLEQDESINTLRMKERFFYKCLHDMGNSLSIISCYSKLMLKGKYQEVPEKIKNVLEGMDKQIDTTLHLFEELQNFGDVVSSDFSIHKVNVQLKPFLSLFKQAAEFLAAKNKINFQLISDIAVPEFFYMDPKRISQVLSNFLSNSIKHSLSDSIIQLKVSSTSNGDLRFSFKDHGTGMSAFEIDRLFKANAASAEFSEESVARTGIGLKICKRIIDDHKGEFWIESEDGMGSVFNFTLPVESTSNERTFLSTSPLNNSKH